MISKEEMYDFASQIAGITDADLQQYKCGGKTKKKACGGVKLEEGGKNKKQSPSVNDDANDNSLRETLNSRKTDTTNVQTGSPRLKWVGDSDKIKANGKTYSQYKKRK